MGVVQGVHHHLDQVGPLDRLALGQQPQRLPPSLPYGDQVAAGRRALPVPLDLHHGRLEHALGADRGRQRLDGGAGCPVLRAFLGVGLSRSSGTMITAPCAGSGMVVASASFATAWVS
ncbi:hypothetical protein D3C72_1978660 [compost metagenome]